MNKQEHAFPQLGEYGLTIRDYFAAKAMQILLQTIDDFPDENWRLGVTIDAYKMADAMMEAREK